MAQRKVKVMCFLSQVALAHGGFNQPEMLSSELQAQDVTVTQLQQEVIAVLIFLLTKIGNKTYLNKCFVCIRTATYYYFYY